MTTLLKLPELAELVPDDALLALPCDYSGPPMALVRAILARDGGPPIGLGVLCVPYGTLAVDLLIGAGCVDDIEAAAVSLGEHGSAPCFLRHLRTGALTIRDSTCPAVYAGLQAAEKGVPFMPLRGLIDSDLLAFRPDWRVIENPFADADPDPIALIPAISPDMFLFHAPLADSEGNILIGRRRELMLAAHAAKNSLCTVERIVDGCLFDDDRVAGSVLPSMYVGAFAQAERGAWPHGLVGHYDEDGAVLTQYIHQATCSDGYHAWLDWFRTARPKLAA